MARLFRPKRTGFGYTPAGWAGWAFTAAALAAILLTAKLLRPAHAPALLYGIIAGIVAVYIGVAVWSGRSS